MKRRITAEYFLGRTRTPTHVRIAERGTIWVVAVTLIGVLAMAAGL